jgi:hypothetical protein
MCGATVQHAQWFTPLALPSAGSQSERVKRDVVQASYWAIVNAGKSLEEYLKTREGQPYACCGSTAEVQQADQYVNANPLMP